jgi:hypothetical protein
MVTIAAIVINTHYTIYLLFITYSILLFRLRLLLLTIQTSQRWVRYFSPISLPVLVNCISDTAIYWKTFVLETIVFTIENTFNNL